MQLFRGNLGELAPYPTTHEYSLSTPLYSDYAYKFRTISLPEGAQMSLDGNGLLQFPDNTVITKTFYYWNDERNHAMGRKLIETRLLIKKNGVWSMGNYLWNEEQTEATFSNSAPTVPVEWIDSNGGATQNVNYQVPFTVNCTQCHNVNDTPIPIGPKARNLNITYNGENQLQYFMDKGLLVNSSLSEIDMLPTWMIFRSHLKNGRGLILTSIAHIAINLVGFITRIPPEGLICVLKLQRVVGGLSRVLRKT